jgi:signal peptidase I
MTLPTAPVDPNAPFADDEEVSGHNPRKALIEWGIIIAVAILVAILIKTFAFQAFYIPSESMDPTLKVHDRVLVNKLSYRFGEIERGDIVVFERPPAEQGGDPAIKDLIKRVIGMPGDKVEGRDGHVWLNDQMLDEPYLPDGVTTLDFPAQTIQADHYWVMGDNRPRSKDSRYFGAIHEDLIVGRAFIRVWPIPNVSLL